MCEKIRVVWDGRIIFDVAYEWEWNADRSDLPDQPDTNPSQPYDPGNS